MGIINPFSKRKKTSEPPSSYKKIDDRSVEPTAMAERAAKLHDVAAFMQSWGTGDVSEMAAKVVAECAPNFLVDLARFINSSADIKERGRAANIITQAVSMLPNLAEAPELEAALQNALNCSDFFVSGNAEHTLELLRRRREQSKIANEISQAPKSAPGEILRGRHSSNGPGWYCPYCGKSDYEPYPNPSSSRRLCHSCKKIFTTE